MPYIRVTIDGEILASIATDGWEVVGVNVGGARVHQEYASVNASAGAYPVNSAAEYRIWIDQRPLLPGQRVEVALLESDLPIGDGKTIAELYPSTVSESSAHSADSAAAFDELRSMMRIPAIVNTVSTRW
jgi:hypothetical protein